MFRRVCSGGRNLLPTFLWARSRRPVHQPGMTPKFPTRPWRWVKFEDFKGWGFLLCQMEPGWGGLPRFPAILPDRLNLERKPPLQQSPSSLPWDGPDFDGESRNSLFREEFRRATPDRLRCPKFVEDLRPPAVDGNCRHLAKHPFLKTCRDCIRLSVVSVSARLKKNAKPGAFVFQPPCLGSNRWSGWKPK